MKYKIEIWRYHIIINTFESDDINEIIKWYKKEYQYMYELGECTFYVYLDGEMLNFDEKERLGFYEYDD